MRCNYNSVRLFTTLKQFYAKKKTNLMNMTKERQEIIPKCREHPILYGGNWCIVSEK